MNEWMRIIDDVGGTQKYSEATHMQSIQSRPKTAFFIEPDTGNHCSLVTGNVKSSVCSFALGREEQGTGGKSRKNVVR